MKIFETYIENLITEVQLDTRFLAVCWAGSAISGELDIYSDLDIVLVTENHVTLAPDEMKEFANQIGNLLVGFTGEHVGENRLLICLYNSPLLHVDLKFIQIQDFHTRVENPKIIFDRYNQIPTIYKNTKAVWPKPDFQWIEDRFWVWIHYVATKLGRGEFFEAIDFLSFLRANVLGPLFHLKYEKDPRGVRKLDFLLSLPDLEKLKATLPIYEFDSIYDSVFASIQLYWELIECLNPNFVRHVIAEKESLQYLKDLKKGNSERYSSNTD